VHIDGTLKDGDIAVIRLGYKIYIRKIYFDKKRVRLETESGNPSPLIIDRETPGFEIVGKVVTVIREL
jgi:SOS-response transcriptional repressor LexA